MKPRRQNLRARSTLAEKILWSRLSNNKLGYKFFRQYSVEGYVLDFYCPEKRLGIELEGKIHSRPQVKTYDEYRKKYLEAYDIKLLVIKNEEVLENIHNSLAKIAISLS